MSEKEYPKDKLFLTKSVKVSKDKKGNDRIELSVSQADAIALIEEVTKNLENPRGVKIDLHVTTRTSAEGRQFNGGFFFLKGVADPATFKKQQFAAKPAAAFDVSAKIAQLKAGLNKPVT